MDNDSEMVVERTTISLTKEDKKKLEDLSKEEHRPMSQQIVHMMEFYMKYRDKK